MELVENFLGVLERQHNLIEQLSNNKTGSNDLANKNIVKSPNSSFNDEVNNSKLDSSEKSRVKEVSSIFISKFFEEQKRQRKDKAEKTLVSKISKPVTKSLSKESNSGSKTNSGWLSKLLDLLGLSPLLGLGGLKKLISKALSKLLGLGKKITSFLKNSLKKVLGLIFRSIGRVLGSVWNGLKSVLSKTWSGIKKGLGSLGSKFKGFFKSIGKTIGGMWENIKSSKAFKSLSGIFKSAKSAISDFFKGIKNKILGVVKKATEGIADLVPGGVKKAVGKATSVAGKVLGGAKSVAGKATSVAGKVLGGAKSVAGKVGGAKSVAKSVAGKSTSVAGKVLGGAKSVAGKATSVAGKVLGGAKSVVGKVGGVTLNAAKKTVSYAASKVIKNTGGMFKMMGRLTAKGAARVPIIGPAIEGVLATMDINAMKKKGLKEEDLQNQAGKRVIAGVTGMVGAAGGAALAGALGSIIPGAGTAIGAILGASVGDMAGRFLGGLISDYIIPKKYTRSIGAFVTGTTPPKDEMQDFIIKDGKVHRFNRRDELMGMKTGGAIDKFLGGGEIQNKAMSVLVKTNMLANEYLKAIAHNTAIMVKSAGTSSGGGSPIIVSSPPQQKESKQTMTIPNNRDGYLSSSYAIG